MSKQDGLRSELAQRAARTLSAGATRGDEPRPDDAIYIPPPRELADRPHASEFWEVHLPLLVKNRMITEVDMTPLRRLCLAYEAWILAEQSSRKRARSKRRRTATVQSPWSTIAAGSGGKNSSSCCASSA
jgi:phage terminase small subunit